MKIGDSDPAVQFAAVAQPNDYQRGLKSATTEARTGARGVLYKAFWERLLIRIHNDHVGWTRARKAQPQPWMTIRPVPNHGGTLNVAFGSGSLRTEIYWAPVMASATWRSSRRFSHTEPSWSRPSAGDFIGMSSRAGGPAGSATRASGWSPMTPSSLPISTGSWTASAGG